MEVLRLSTGYLEEKGIESPRLTAELLLSDVLGCRRIDLYLWFDRPIEEKELSTFRRYLRLRAGGTPVDYITGKSEFYGLQLEVDPRVMIPRPETEILVEKVLAFLEDCAAGSNGDEELLFLDLGVGSGAISLALLDQLPASTAMAVDISLDALQVACLNADILDFSFRFNPVQGDLYRPVKDHERFDLIVSNPPYIPGEERDNLPREVREHEPSVALFAADGGLATIRGVVKGAPEHLRKGGILAIEIGAGQGEEAVSIVERVPALNLLALEKDLSGVERIVLARKEGE